MCVLSAENISYTYQSKYQKVQALTGVSCGFEAGKFYAIVGQSGSGKSTVARCVMNLYRPWGGRIFYKSIDTCDPQAFRTHKRMLQRTRQMIFQDSMAALHPRFSIQESLEEPLILNGMKDAAQRAALVSETLFKVGLDTSYCSRYPRSLSGGQRQRVAIARALAAGSGLILADEPISALDVSLQAQVLNLLMDLKDEFHLSMLFVAHDLAVVRQIADYTLIMYAGKIMEAAPAARIYDSARHPYTKVLLKSAPSIKKGVQGEDFHLDLKIGDAPDPACPPSGCPFHTRCVHANDACACQAPEMEKVGEGHFVRCPRWREV